ncbi:MAG: eCIS core domain-containing protein [Myxococcota bacterium]
MEPFERDAILDALETTGIADKQTCLDALDSCRLIERRPALAEIRGPRSVIAYVALRTRASGITLGDRVFIRSDCFRRTGRPPLDLIAHEVAHVVQFRRDGATVFLARYLLDYAKNLTRGMADRDAYLAIRYEREARRVEAALRTP